MDIGSFSSSYQSVSYGARIRPDPVDMTPEMSTKDRSKLGMVSVMQDESKHDTMTRYALTRDVSLHGGNMMPGHSVENVDDYIEMLYKRAEENGGKDFYGVSSQRYANLIDVRV
ncbi:hypothetical protein [Alkalimarinus sediminis]|uniref:Uncharacterized protein n=1 Tax=Alkalimarinus sediminis TaxID=1632866 RepID=A0A9E8KQB5_9ALTE|nr:hypothetical protein [Alkalimarinus sediminis]UZW76253.1 hypothetical protein NNL22_06635 [Alkalimarinus sediminis]